MIRDRMRAAQTGEKHFHWRGGDVSRLEGLTDGVFALSLTLLVVSLEVPATIAELRAAFVQLPVFLVCFALLVLIWQSHFRFHRRYGLEDPTTIFLDTCLLFLVLFYVYPLKFVFRTLHTIVLHGGPWVLDERGEPVRDPQGATGEFLAALGHHDMRFLMILYGAGFAAIFIVFAAQTGHAWRLRASLALDAAECEMTRTAFVGHLIMAAFGLLSISIALALPEFLAASGLVYWLIGPVMWWWSARGGRRADLLAQSSDSRG